MFVFEPIRLLLTLFVMFALLDLFLSSNLFFFTIFYEYISAFFKQSNYFDQTNVNQSNRTHFVFHYITYINQNGELSHQSHHLDIGSPQEDTSSPPEGIYTKVCFDWNI